jgi:RNA-directed DNA polymerase
MRGHYAYYGITGNTRRLRWYAHRVQTTWYRWLSTRSRGGRGLRWRRYEQLLDRYPLPAPRIVHRYATASEAAP